jgi:hypothetical protein
MAKAPKSSTPSYEVVSGELHKDNWSSRQLALRLDPDPQARTIRVTVWNPYFNRDYLNNLVKVRLDGRGVFSEKLHPAASAVVEYELPAGEPLDVEVESEAHLLPDPLDPRERGVIVKLGQEALKA